MSMKDSARTFGWLVVATLAWGIPGQARAEIPATLRLLEGELLVHSKLEAPARRASSSTPIFSGDRLESRGFVELQLEDGSLIWLADGTILDLNALSGPVAIRLWQGAVGLAPLGFGTWSVESDAGRVKLQSPGLCLVTHSLEGLQLSVVEGFAELSTASATLHVEAGQSVSYDSQRGFVLAGLAESPSNGDFAARVRERARASTAPSGISSLVVERSYAELEDYGGWVELDQLGTAWSSDMVIDWGPHETDYWPSPFGWDGTQGYGVCSFDPRDRPVTVARDRVGHRPPDPPGAPDGPLPPLDGRGPWQARQFFRANPGGDRESAQPSPPDSGSAWTRRLDLLRRAAAERREVSTGAPGPAPRPAPTRARAEQKTARSPRESAEKTREARARVHKPASPPPAPSSRQAPAAGERPAPRRQETASPREDRKPKQRSSDR